MVATATGLLQGTKTNLGKKFKSWPLSVGVIFDNIQIGSELISAQRWPFSVRLPHADYGRPLAVVSIKATHAGLFMDWCNHDRLFRPGLPFQSQKQRYVLKYEFERLLAEGTY